jgi:hypothetical protein
LGTGAAHAAVRETVPFLESDTSTGAYLEQLERRVHDGSIVAGAEAAVGALLVGSDQQGESDETD